MSYRWTTNTATPVTVNGTLDAPTIKALQYGLNGVGLTGSFGPVTVKALQTFLNSTGAKLTVDGAFGPLSAKALQTRLGVTADGQFGSGTIKALQTALNKGTLGSAPVVSSPPVSTPPAGGSTGSSTAGRISESQVTYGHYSGGGNVDGWIQSACTASGRPYNSAWRVGYETIISRESSGDANAINNYDSNATGAIQADGYPQNCSRGVAQCIPPTFADNHQAGTALDIYDPVANIAASMNYVAAQYRVSLDGSNLASNVQQADPNRSPKGY